MEQVEGDRCRLNVTTLKALLLVFYYTDWYENIFIRAMMNFIFEPVWTNRLTMSRCLQLVNVTNNRVRASRSQSVNAAVLCSSPYLFPWPLRHLCKKKCLTGFLSIHVSPAFLSRHISALFFFAYVPLLFSFSDLLQNSSCMVVYKESLQSPTTPFLFTWLFHPNFSVYVQCLKFSAIQRT